MKQTCEHLICDWQRLTFYTIVLRGTHILCRCASIRRSIEFNGPPTDNKSLSDVYIQMIL